MEDNGRWHHSKKRKIISGITRQYLPAYSPRLELAERLWTLVGERLVHEYFKIIDQEIFLNPHKILSKIKEEIQNQTHSY